MTRLQTLTSTQLMSVSFAPSPLVVSPVACASSTLHAQRSGQRRAPPLTGLNCGAKLSPAGVSRQALLSQNARCRYCICIFSLSASLHQWMWAHGTWQYSIVLYPKHSPEQTETEPLLKEEVLLTLRNATGVVPRSQAPPGVTPAQIERRSLVPPRDFPVGFGFAP